MESRANIDLLDLPSQQPEEQSMLPLAARPLGPVLRGILISLFPQSFPKERGPTLSTDATIIHTKPFLDPLWNPTSSTKQFLYKYLEWMESVWLGYHPNSPSLPPLSASEEGDVVNT